MSDEQRPLFFGGLPPRGAVPSVRIEAVAEPGDAPDDTADLDTRPSRRQLGRWTALIAKHKTRFYVVGFAVLLVLAVAAGVATGIRLVQGAGPEQQTISSGAAPLVSATPSSKQAAEAKAAIASGGGAIAGHVVSGQLCTAVKAFEVSTRDLASNSSKTPHKVLTAMAGLASVPSPYQPAYRAYLAMKKKPESVASVAKAQQITATFTKDIQIDLATCP